MASKKLEDSFTQLQLDTEDIVIETWVMLKKKYDGVMREVLDKIALWWLHNDIKSLTDAQANMNSLMSELDGILDPAYEELIEDMTKLFAEVYAFNAEYAKKSLEIENEDEEDYLLLFSLLGLASIPWVEDGLTYAERMRLRKTQLKDNLKTILLRASIIGLGTKKLLKMIEDEMGKPKYSGAAVVVDESNHFANEAVRKVAETEYAGYEISEVLDGKTCDTCRAMHGMYYNWSEYQVGLTAPKFHSRCRGRIIPAERLI